MLREQKFEKGSLYVTLERVNKDRGLILVRKYNEIQKLNSFYTDIELELKDINFIVETLKNSPFIFSKNNN